MTSLDSPCLLLSHDYIPLKIINAKQCFKLLFTDKAAVIVEYADKIVRTVNKMLKIPAVIRLIHKFNLKFNIRLTRKNIFVRDRYRCQYCGQDGTASSLTLDHCTPRSKGGKFSWDNLVASCVTCNSKKGDRTPHEAGMPLMRGKPRRLELFEYIDFMMSQRHWIPEWASFLS
jgi:5-methylcytosine-specific restriction endonuclease McrA